MKGLQRVTDVKLLTSRVEELSYHLLEFPETRGIAVKVSVYLSLFVSSSFTFTKAHFNVRCVVPSADVL